MAESNFTQITVPVTRIRPSRGWRAINLRELWDYRELIYFLTWRDIKVRYKQTILGALWAIIQPIFTMIIFSIFFGALAGVPSDGVPYPLFAFAALVPWTFFANGLTMSTNSMVSSANLIRKVYFPRLAIPISSIGGGLLDFLLAFAVLVGMVIYYQVPITANLIFLPLLFLLALVTSLGAGMWLSAMNVQFRDVRFAVPFLVQAWMFATPIAYPSSLLAEHWRAFYALNPMVGVVEGFRWALLGLPEPPVAVMFVSTMASIVLFISGAYYFRRMEKTFADVV